MLLFLGKSYHWLSVDTDLYILKENETQENLQLVSFTEQQNKEVRWFCIPILIIVSLVYVLMLHGWVPMCLAGIQTVPNQARGEKKPLFCACSLSKLTELVQGKM